MAWQLVYTSAPALLDSGRTGFGTVAKHEAIRATLQSELERISQFSREEGLGKERVIYYYRALDIRGEHYHVLSRIKDAGADYTGRTNHIAHHIVLSDAEVNHVHYEKHCTPVDVIAWITSNGLWLNQWNESARLFSSTEEISLAEVFPRYGLPAQTWRSVTGKAANAAILAPGGHEIEGCWILYREDQSSQLLALLGESLCLNPTPWSISFSTDTQPTDRTEEIQWRGVAEGSPLEMTARQSVRPTLDLGKPATLPSPVESSVYLAEGETRDPLSDPLRTIDKKSSKSQWKLEGDSDEIDITASNHQIEKTASLKERMKGSSGGVQKKINPVRWIFIGLMVSLILLLIVLIKNEFILNEKNVDTLIQNANIVLENISSEHPDQKREPVIPNDFKLRIIKENTLLELPGDVRITIGLFNREVDSVKKNITDSNSKLNYNAENGSGLLKSVCKEIQKNRNQRLEVARNLKLANAKKDAYNALKEAERILSQNSKPDNISDLIAIKNNLDKATNGTNITSIIDITEKLRGANSKSIVVPESTPTPTPLPSTTPIPTPVPVQKVMPQKAAKLIIEKYKEDPAPWDRFFPDNKMPTKIVAWFYENDPPGGIIKAIKKTDTHDKWFTEVNQLQKNNFDDSIKNASASLVCTKDFDNKITEYIIYTTKLPTETYAVNGGVFFASNRNEDFTLTVNPEISSFVQLWEDSGMKSEYIVYDDVKKTNIAIGTSLQDLSNQINEKLEKSKSNVANAQNTNALVKSEQSKPDGNLKTIKDKLYQFGPDLFKGVQTDNKENIKPYSDWLNENKLNDQKDFFETYKNYLRYVLSTKIPKNSPQSSYFSNLRNNQSLTGSSSIKECFAKMSSSCDDFNKKLADTSRYGAGSNDEKKNDGHFISNLKEFFDLPVTDVERVFPMQGFPVNREAAIKNAIHELDIMNEIIQALKQGGSHQYKPQIKLKYDSSYLFIFTSP